jgi:hypothetical protein
MPGARSRGPGLSECVEIVALAAQFSSPRQIVSTT